jgi:hypothetical protein
MFSVKKQLMRPPRFEACAKNVFEHIPTDFVPNIFKFSIASSFVMYLSTNLRFEGIEFCAFEYMIAAARKMANIRKIGFIFSFWSFDQSGQSPTKTMMALYRPQISY